MKYSQGPFKRALITGASSGLGSSLAKLLHQKKIPLILTGRDEKRLREIAQECEAEWVCLDLLKDRKKLIEWIHQKVPDLVINNAGFNVYGKVLSLSSELSSQIFELNAIAPIEISIEAARALEKNKRRGTILNISSLAGELNGPYMALYGSGKAALSSFSKSFDAEMNPSGIHVLVSLPGPILTPFAASASFGRFKPKKNFWTLEPDLVAQKIWEQIEKKKRFSYLSWRYAFAFQLAKWIPQKLWDQNMMKELKDRFLSEDI